MLFNSMQFLVFFPAVCLVYFVVPQRVRYLWLLAASYYFYMCWNAKYALLMFTSTLITYASGLLIQRAGANVGQKKLWVALSFGSNLAILFFFKYFTFAVQSLQTVFGQIGVQLNTPAFDVLLPVGISFYTFQALGYTMDVYRGEIPPEKNLLKYALFVSFFPQLVAGPIERSANLLRQVCQPRPFVWEKAKSGLALMLWGLFEKMVIADRLAVLVNQVYGEYWLHGSSALIMATVLFAFQIYCDFGGYSHIAIGAARVMGFELMQNFRQPYFATSVQDFWRRWHISLSTWFRDYLYIPLGGNRKGKRRKYLNLLATFLASGLWHGAAWTYVVWGGLNGVFQVVGECTAPLRKKAQARLGVKTHCFSHRLGKVLLTFGLICLTWVFFRAPSCGAALDILRRIFTQWDFWQLVDGTLYTWGLSVLELRVALWALIALLAVDVLGEKGQELYGFLARQNTWFRWGVYLALLCAVFVYGVYGPGYDASQFIYFQF